MPTFLSKLLMLAVVLSICRALLSRQAGFDQEKQMETEKLTLKISPLSAPTEELTDRSNEKTKHCAAAPWTELLSLSELKEKRIGLFQRLSGNEVRGIAGENDCDVCVSRLTCLLFFRFKKPTIHHCFVPHFSNGRRKSPSLSYHSFPLSNELSKRCY